jgi:hypothetical protein
VSPGAELQRTRWCAWFAAPVVAMASRASTTRRFSAHDLAARRTNNSQFEPASSTESACPPNPPQKEDTSMSVTTHNAQHQFVVVGSTPPPRRSLPIGDTVRRASEGKQVSSAVPELKTFSTTESKSQDDHGDGGCVRSPPVLLSLRDGGVTSLSVRYRV